VSDPASVSALAARLHRAARDLAARARHLADARDAVARWPGPAAAALQDVLAAHADATARAGAAVAEAAAALQGHAVDLSFARSSPGAEGAGHAAESARRLSAALDAPVAVLGAVPASLAGSRGAAGKG
jgi:hypothetical protein